MGKPIAITHLELAAAELRELAAKTHDGAVVRRLLRIALVLEGHSREAAAGMDRQTLCDWIHRYNEDGTAGLSSHTSPGRPPALSKPQMQELQELVLEGPDPERHEVIRCVAPTCAMRLPPAGRSTCTNAPLAHCCAGLGCPGCNRDRISKEGCRGAGGF